MVPSQLIWGVLPGLFLLLSGCSEEKNTLTDGYFTAESFYYNEDGWKDYLTIYVNNGHITIVEFDATNRSGFRRSWDMDYMVDWYANHDIRPGKYPLSYQNSLLTLQDPNKVQALPGGRNMHQVFTILANHAIDHSKRGDRSVAFPQLGPKEYPGDI